MIESNVLTIEQASTITGLSKSRIYKLVHAKEIPHYKNPHRKRLFFKRTEIEDWLCRGRVATNEEVAQQAAKYNINKIRS